MEDFNSSYSHLACFAKALTLLDAKQPKQLMQLHDSFSAVQMQYRASEVDKIKICNDFILYVIQQGRPKQFLSLKNDGNLSLFSTSSAWITRQNAGNITRKFRKCTFLLLESISSHPWDKFLYCFGCP